MRLTSFRVTNYRSIFDSGNVNTVQITALLGRNESGKSNLLKALASVNPAGGMKPYSRIKDFPRSKALSECTDQTLVVVTQWDLAPDEKKQLEALYPRAKSVDSVAIYRNYGAEGSAPTRHVIFVGMKTIDSNSKEIETKLRKIVPQLKAIAIKIEDNDKKAKFEQEVANFQDSVKVQQNVSNWASKAKSGCGQIRTAIALADQQLSNDAELTEIEELAEEIVSEPGKKKAASDFINGLLPVFVYLDDYPCLNGHQNIGDYLNRAAGNALDPFDRSFEKLCKVAGLVPKQLQDLNNKGEVETRNQLANRSSAIVTQEIRRLWKDRALKIRFNLDSHYMDTLISDPNAVYDVEVNLNERSRGFQWFFSFYITFAADTKGFEVDQAVLLLDEPGLFLHAKSQKDLLIHFRDFKNTILYTTHSPFMVPTDQLDSIRTVSIDESAGTTVTNDPSGDARTLFPLQAALGYDLSQSLFVGPNNLVVEGVTDFWLLSTISNYLADLGKTSLNPSLTLTPSGGAQKVSYMVALLASEELNVLVLLDREKQSNVTKDELVKTKLISAPNVIFVDEAFPGGASTGEVDIEDLMDTSVYESLVRESYKKELKGITLKLNSDIPRIAKRFESAFADAGLPYHKTRPTRLFLTKMASEPKKVMPEPSVELFQNLFKIINERLDKQLRRSSQPFQ